MGSKNPSLGFKGCVQRVFAPDETKSHILSESLQSMPFLVWIELVRQFKRWFSGIVRVCERCSGAADAKHWLAGWRPEESIVQHCFTVGKKSRENAKHHGPAAVPSQWKHFQMIEQINPD